MTDVAFQVRLDAETHREWRVKAAQHGFRSVAELVRASVAAYPHAVVGGVILDESVVGKTPSIDTPAGEVHLTAAQHRRVDPPRDIDPAECPKKVGHRKGVYCKHCGATP